jgi:hypothetical protein
VGGGFDFTKGLFAGVGVHAPYSLIGLDLHPFVNEKKLEPYIQIDTIKKYKKNHYGPGVCTLNAEPFGGYWDNATCDVEFIPG